MTRTSAARTDRRKQAVSVRMRRSDLHDIKQLAERLGAHESDVIRFAIKIMLERLSPLQHPKVRGRSLVPVFMDLGADLIRHFELDSTKLSAIINDGVEDARSVEPDDIELIAMTATQRSLLHLRVPGLRRPEAAADRTGEDARLDVDGMNGHDQSRKLEQSLRNYLYQKYLFAGVPASTNGSGGDA